MGLTHVAGRVIISCDLEKKNWHTFSDGTKIRRERQFNELNRRISEPVNAVCISGENIPNGVEILIHPNAICATNEIHNFARISGDQTSSDIKYYSISEDQCFIYKDEQGNWMPLPPFETALRVFEPYNGILQGIEPKQLKNTLFVTSGELAGKVVKTVVAADYEIIFQDSNGRESRIIRFRPFGDPKTGKEEEAIAILNDETEKVLNGELLIGIEIKDAKKIETTTHAD